MKYWGILLLLLLSTPRLQGQEYKYQIQGKVIDKEAEEPLPYATILIVGTQEGTVSDLDGNFELVTDHDTPLQIEVSFIGFQTQRIEISKRDNQFVRIELEPLNIIIGPPEIIEYRLPNHMRTPGSLQWLGKNQILRDDETLLNQALNRVPGVFMQSAALNTNRLTIRGIGSRTPFSTNRVRLYFGEIPLTNGVGESAIEDIDLSMLFNANVWRGPSPSRYGAGLGGMVQLQSYFDLQSPSAVEVRSVFGSFGLNRQVVNAQLVDGDWKNGLRLNVFRTHSDGYRNNNEVDRLGLSFLAKFGLGTNGETTINGFWSQGTAFIPSSLNEEDFRNNPQLAAANWQGVEGFESSDQFWLGIGHRQFLAEVNSGNWYYQLSTFMRLQDGLERRPFNTLDEHRQIIGLRTAFTFESAGHDPFPYFALGAELFQEQYQWQTYETLSEGIGLNLSDNRERRSYYQIFAEGRIPLAYRLNLHGGVNVNQTHYEYVDQFQFDSIDFSGNYRYQVIVSPNLSLRYEYQNHVAYLRASHGSSVPSLEETLTPDGAINPNIRPERGWNLELGARGKTARRNAALKDFAYDVVLYHMWVQDLLVAERITPDQFVGINAGRTQHLGLEVGLNYFHFVKAMKSHFHPYLNYHWARYRFVEFVDDGEDFGGNPLTGVPPHQLSAGLTWVFLKNFKVQADYQFVSSFSMRDDNTLQSDAYQTLNLQLGYELTWNAFSFSLGLGVQNVFDEQYASMILINAPSFGGNAPRYYYPGLSRNFFAKIGVRYVLPKLQ
ncbi:MAG: TonB-dependent receptor [Bacteroidota bacterium]